MQKKSLLDFRQAQSAAERSGVAGPHCWSLMLPTSARVAQEVCEPLIGIVLCSRLGDTWQIGTTSIREDHQEARQIQGKQIEGSQTDSRKPDRFEEARRIQVRDGFKEARQIQGSQTDSRKPGKPGRFKEARQIQRSHTYSRKPDRFKEASHRSPIGI